MEPVQKLITSKFKVKFPDKFPDIVSQAVGGNYVSLTPYLEGFVLKGENLYIKNGANPEGHEIDLASFLQEHLVDDAIVRLTLIYLNEGLDVVEASHMVVTKIAQKMTTSSNVFKELERTIFPRFVVCNTDIHSSSTGEWLSKDNHYMAVEEYRDRTRKYYLIKHPNGRTTLWGKEYFNGVEDSL